MSSQDTSFNARGQSVVAFRDLSQGYVLPNASGVLRASAPRILVELLQQAA